MSAPRAQTTPLRVLRGDRRGPPLIEREVLDAAARARRIVEEAEDEAEAIRERARERGRAEAQAEAARELTALTRAHERAMDALEPQAIEVALLAARTIIGHELTTHPALAAQMVAPLLDRLRRARQLTVHVHPDDRAAVEALLARPDGPAAGLAARVEVDASLERGDCLLHSDIGSLDARIDVRIAALSAALASR